MIIQALKRMEFGLLRKAMGPLASWYVRVSPRMISCREFNDFIFDYTEGLLTDEQVILFERHMKFCPMCRNYLKTYIAAYKTGKAFFPYSDRDVPDTVPADLLDAINDVSDT